jgi:bifunctional ADP-heptose synthase (sugar kinase/adenylyltransferase)
LGDWIDDSYRICNATRLCPEAPVPVLVESRNYTSPGGMGLVVEQLKTLLDNGAVSYVEGSRSRKERIFADGHLVCRVDYDADKSHKQNPQLLENTVLDTLKMVPPPKLIIVSDYGKGALTESSAMRIMYAAREQNIPVLVDAKKNWSWYKDAYAYFPNQHETNTVAVSEGHVIWKVGARGCEVYRYSDHQRTITSVPPKHERKVMDCTGAGDVFLAAFASKLLTYKREVWDNRLVECAEFANYIAGISVEHIGTFCVTGEKP